MEQIAETVFKKIKRDERELHYQNIRKRNQHKDEGDNAVIKIRPRPCRHGLAITYQSFFENETGKKLSKKTAEKFLESAVEYLDQPQFENSGTEESTKHLREMYSYFLSTGKENSKQR